MGIRTKLAKASNIISSGGFELIYPQGDKTRRAAAKILQDIDRTAIANQVVAELDREYPPMDESFDSETAYRAAHLAMDKLVTRVEAPAETVGGKR